MLAKLEHEAAVKTVAFSPDGQRVATCTGVSPESRPGVGAVIVWDWASQSRQHTLSHPSAVNDVAFSPDGKQIATASADGTARIWNLETKEVETEFLAHEGNVWAVAFSPDGKLLATAGEDQKVRLHYRENPSPILLAPARAELTIGWSKEDCLTYLNMECTDAPAAQGVEMFIEGKRLALRGDLKGATAQFQQAQQLYPVLDIDAWNYLKPPFDARLLRACDRAVALEPENINYRDSRGLARAMIGDHAGAIEDFEDYLKYIEKSRPQYVAQRRRWIARLKKQKERAFTTPDPAIGKDIEQLRST